VTLKLLLFLCMLECMGEMINAYRIEAGNPEGRHHLRDQDIKCRVISKWTLSRM
jgi:hypothetical protein